VWARRKDREPTSGSWFKVLAHASFEQHCARERYREIAMDIQDSDATDWRFLNELKRELKG
jgi:hypothetical protein